MYYRENNAVSGDPLIEFSFSTDIAVTPRVPTCSVANSRQSVDLEKINASEVGQAGVVPARTKSFNIKLNCSGGDRGTATRAFVTLTDANQANNFGKVLTLQKTSQIPGEKLAEGIGLHIMKADNTILGFGPASSAAGTTNQWEAGKINQAPGTTEFTIPLKAGYVKTGVPIKAGKVYAQAIFTMSYQ
ncbi:F17a-G fimbrial adhesin precursor [Delftia tsuruhatensis]|nr:F17a-G fimbrial adhesin precursor [Delftia tsuruhatensis]CAC9676732.1 F17a-G fimbrial adhesin precursor [Delftia tsuruhatensis]